MVVHVALRIGDVEQPRGLAAADDELQRFVDLLAILSAAGGMAGRHEGEGAHAY
jgi:hypothetical protein